MENGLKLMQKALASRQGGADLNGPTMDALGRFQGLVTSYLTTALNPSLAVQGKPLGLRNERELRTLAEALDALLRGDLPVIGDILLQRFRAVELNAIEGDWKLAHHLELIPQHAVSCVPPGMRQAIVQEQNKLDKYASKHGEVRR